MYADPHALVALADDLRARGECVRRLAADVADGAAAVHWRGAAADAMRRVTRLGRESLLDLADQHDRVAELLSAHAQDVAGRLGPVLGVLPWLELVA